MDKRDRELRPEDNEGGEAADGRNGPEEVSAPEAAATADEECRQAKQQLGAYKDKYLRLCAEFENTRKRYDRDRAEFIKYANEGLLVNFLSVMDDLDRSVQAARVQHQDYQAFLKGIEMVMGRVHALLKQYNVKPIEAVGRTFDPHYHEILMQVESDDVAHATVVEEFQKGYCLGDKVIRTSKVKVAVRKDDGATETESP